MVPSSHFDSVSETLSIQIEEMSVDPDKEFDRAVIRQVKVIFVHRTERCWAGLSDMV